MSSCGSRKKESTAGTDEKNQTQKAENKQHEQAKSRIEQWLGKEASKRVASSAIVLANDIAMTAAQSANVQKAIGKLINNLFKEKKVKKRTDKIADKATAGLRNKFRLLGKAIAAGGISEYKKKIKEKTTKVTKRALEEHIRQKILKDPRLSKVIKSFLPVLSIQGKLAAATLQSNLSPKVAQKVFGISLTLSVKGDSKETSAKVEKWISSCNGHMESQMDKLFKEISNVPSVKKAVENLAVEILNHPTTKRELAQMMINILEDKNAYNAAVKVYEEVAFDKGEQDIHKSIINLFNLPVVDTQLFLSLNNLAKAKGAGNLMSKHISQISEDKKMAELIDNFLINLLVTCGDITI
jgi:hypothetical protein